MASEFIQNPRRAPRAPARCTAKVICSAGVFQAETEDVGSHGCQAISPRVVRRGEAVKLTISNPRLPDALRIAGRVAWASPQAPWRLGIAFDPGALSESGRWFERLIAAYPGLAPFRRIPERISVDAMVYLGPPPRLVVDFTRDEVALLRAIGSGTSVGELRGRLEDDWTPKLRALFSLLAHQHVTLSRGASVHPDSWTKLLAGLEASLAAEDLRAPDAAAPAPTPPATPVPSARAVEPRAAARNFDTAGGWARAPQASAPAPDFTGAGVGWRAPARPRPAEAQVCLDRARAEEAAGRLDVALALLRRALALAPGDAEIAAATGELAFRDRARNGR